jgi:hypothetical protein
MNNVLSGFSNPMRPVRYLPTKGANAMFMIDRSALAVLLPLAMLVGVVLWSRADHATSSPQRSAHEESAHSDQAVAANLPSR